MPAFRLNEIVGRAQKKKKGKKNEGEKKTRKRNEGGVKKKPPRFSICNINVYTFFSLFESWSFSARILTFTRPPHTPATWI